MHFYFTVEAEKQFFALDKNVQIIIRKKIKKIQEEGGGKFIALTDLEPATHRLRIGDRRLILKLCEGGFDVLKAGHRSTVYKK